MKKRVCIKLTVASGIFISALLLGGCGGESRLAPVVNAWYQPKHATFYRVRRGDTIYSIAWAFGLDYRALARANGLRAPYSIDPGQRLKMTAVPSGRYVAKAPKFHEKVSRQSVRRHHKKTKKPINPVRINRHFPKVVHWRWPVNGKIMSYFSRHGRGRPGITLAGHYRMPLRAAASGVVVYSGDGVRGYGNLIIIKHNDSYLSAYGFNAKNLVRVGQFVRAGKIIALMGKNSEGHPRLYFEIRRDGHSVNPLKFLKN